jgi:hypothetical protein
MVKTTTEEALVVLQEVLGGGYFLFMCLFVFEAFNYFFVHIKGIQI